MERTALDTEHYWRERLSGYDEALVLGIEHPSGAPGDRSVREVSLSPAGDAALRAGATRLGTTPEILVVAAWSVLLGRYGGGDDVLFGIARSAADGPRHPVAPMRTGPGGGQRVRDLLGAVAAALPDPARTWPTPREMLAYGELPTAEALYDKVLHLTDRVGRRADADIQPSVEATVTTASPLTLRLDHDTARIEERDAARLLRHFGQLCDSLAAAGADARVSELRLQTWDELDRILHTWNDTAVPVDDPACIHELVERQAARTPDAVALVQGDTAMTYAELDHDADLLAAHLAARGVGPGDFVALHVDRTVHSVVALLGILKSGAAYVPIESSLPEERIRHLLSALDCSAVVCTVRRLPVLGELARDLPGLRHLLVVGETRNEAFPDRVAPDTVTVTPAAAPPAADAPTPRRATPDDLAYVIFTSGSTGTPKGVLLRHAPVVNLIRWVNSTFEMGAEDRVLFITAFGFDLSVYDVFGLLAAGGSIRLADDDEARDPQRLLEILDREPVTFWDSAPAALQQLEPLFGARASSRPAALRLVFLSGDWIPVTLPDAVRAAFPRAEVVSLGGATEAAIWSNFHRVDKVDPRWSSIPYGRPIDNARYYILDGDLCPAPVGVPGDLYIGGSCLASGYFGDEELSARKFIADPFAGTPAARMYHTGDRARFWADGTMEFLGRCDSQVKVRGFRIELGEIEAALNTIDGVGTAVAHVHGSGATAVLVAYAVPAAGQSLHADSLRERLAQALPAYMVPTEVVVLDRLPATPNGKLDRRALPAPGASRPVGARPNTPTEAAVADVWAEVLDRPVGAESDFFALGGQSLLAVRAVARLNSRLGADIPIRTLMENPGLRDFARAAEPFLTGSPA